MEEDYDAYTWIKPCLGYRIVRLDMVDFRGNFSGDIAEQVLGGQAAVNFDKFFYRSERQMSFEVFVTKFINCIYNKERSGMTMSDPYIFDAIWGKVQCSQIDHYKSALQVQQSINQRVWKNILDTPSAQVSKLSISEPIMNVSEVSNSHYNPYTRDGHCTEIGFRTSNGIIFVGGYPDNKCHHKGK